jgi:hypothetical protein
MSLDVWKAFSKLLNHRGETTLRTMRYRETLEFPKSPLQTYTSPLTSISFEFITILSITVPFSLPELVKLSDIPNLGVLEIVNTSQEAQHTVNDRLIRAWNIAAFNDGAFKVLRILRLWKHIDVTSQSLAYLNSFPALGVYDVRGCGFNLQSPIQARRLGWKPTADRNIVNLLHAACVERALYLQEKLGLPAKSIRRAAAKQLWDGAKVSHLSRGDVAAFLTRDETSRPGTPAHGQRFDDMNRMVDSLQNDNPGLEPEIKKHRWSHIDRSMFRETNLLMTWEFQLYSAYARLGELRDDRDLERAGLDISNQAVVGTELVNSVPMVSIRLGRTPSGLMPTSSSFGSHKSIYNNVLDTQSSVSLRRLVVKPKFDPKAMCFIRIDAHSGVQASTISIVETEKEARAVKRKSRTSIAENKKMKLGDVLGSFLS